MANRILVVDDEESLRYTFQAFLEDAGYQVDTAGSKESAFAFIREETFDVVFLDILLGRDSGIDVLKESRERHPTCPVIMVTGAPDIATASAAVRLGAFDYISKPFHQDDLLIKADLAVRHKTLADQQENSRLRMEAVFSCIHEGLLIFNDDGNLVEMNHAASKMVGCPPDWIGQPLSELVESQCGLFSSLGGLIENRCEGEIYSFETTNCQGETLTLSLTMAPLTNEADQGMGVVVVIRDESLRI